MAQIEKGMLSKLILSSLYDEDKYVNEIYEFVANQTKSENKQTNLYSALKKLEDQKLISSYWRENDIGAKRHFYSITDFGKKSIDKWGKISTNNESNLTKTSREEKSNSLILQSNLFDSTNIKEEPQSKSKDVFLQYNLFDKSTAITPPDTTEKSYEKNEQNNKIEGKNITLDTDEKLNASLKNTKVDNYSKISKTYESFSLNRKRKSFSDSAKEFNTYKESSISPLEKTYEEKEEKYDLKNSHVANSSIETSLKDFSNKTLVDLSLSETNEIKQNQNQDINIQRSMQPTSSIADKQTFTKLPEKLEKKDDAVFITTKISDDQIKKVKKISPSLFDAYISDYSISPSLDEKFRRTPYQDRIKELYEKSKENSDNKCLQVANQQSTFNDYNELKDLYKNENIKFFDYNKSQDQNQTKCFLYVNKLALFANSIFCSLSILVILLSLILNVNLLSSTVNLVVFICGIAVVITNLVFSLFMYFNNKTKKIYFDNLINITNNLLISLMFIFILIIVNIIFGMRFTNLSQFYITFTYPLCLLCSYIISLVLKKVFAKKFLI